MPLLDHVAEREPQRPVPESTRRDDHAVRAVLVDRGLDLGVRRRRARRRSRRRCRRPARRSRRRDSRAQAGRPPAPGARRRLRRVRRAGSGGSGAPAFRRAFSHTANTVRVAASSTKASSDANTASPHQTPCIAARAASHPPIAIPTDTRNSAASSADRTEFTRARYRPQCAARHTANIATNAVRPMTIDGRLQSSPATANTNNHAGRDGQHVARDEHEPQAATSRPSSSLRRFEVGVAVAHELLRVRRGAEPPPATGVLVP